VTETGLLRLVAVASLLFAFALLMILWGTLVSTWEISLGDDPSEWKGWILNFLGVSLALYVFMADSLDVAGRGVNVLRDVLPASFNWPLFSLALFLKILTYSSA